MLYGLAVMAVRATLADISSNLIAIQKSSHRVYLLPVIDTL